VRFVAVSATIPNIQDIAAWLEVPQPGLLVYGEEMRPVGGSLAGPLRDWQVMLAHDGPASAAHQAGAASRAGPDCLACSRRCPQVKLRTLVKGYIQPKTDFLFERRLNEFLPGIIQDHSKGRPSLVFCRWAG
jgi:ATP-dependent DNA helicase HFM1/MER3